MTGDLAQGADGNNTDGGEKAQREITDIEIATRPDWSAWGAVITVRYRRNASGVNRALNGLTKSLL
jgi:hypothetical protein